MKKIICIILLALCSGLTVVSCTEEIVTPENGTPSGGVPQPGKL